MTGVVYMLINPLGKCYVGSTLNIKARLRQYRRLSCKSQKKLYNSLNKYKFENHTILILEECILEELYARERYHGFKNNVLCSYNGLNLVLPKEGEVKSTVSKVTRERMGKVRAKYNLIYV